MFLDSIVSIAYKETKDDFEDPEDDYRKIYISKLFTGVADWNFGLFIQELFKQEYTV